MVWTLILVYYLSKCVLYILPLSTNVQYALPERKIYIYYNIYYNYYLILLTTKPSYLDASDFCGIRRPLLLRGLFSVSFREIFRERKIM